MFSTIRENYSKHKFYVSMIYTNEADIYYDALLLHKATWVATFCHYILSLKMFSDDQSRILRNASKNYWIHTKLS